MRFKSFLMNSLDTLSEEGLDNWDEESLKKFGKTIGKDPKEDGFFDACVLRMTPNMGKTNAESFCAKVKDKAYKSTMWRGKDKSKADVNKDTKSNKNVD